MGIIAELKHSMIEKIMGEAPFVLVVVDPTIPGVELPEELLLQTTPVALNIGWEMSIPVPDLKLDSEGISGTLSFNRSPFFCRLPWESVVQVGVEDEHLVWLVPSSKEAKEEPEPEPEPKRPRLKLV